MTSMFDSLVSSRPKTPRRISKQQFEQWQRHFSFDALRGQKYGQSFCRYFGINDFRLQTENNVEWCNRLIQREWIASTCAT